MKFSNTTLGILVAAVIGGAIALYVVNNQNGAGPATGSSVTEAEMISKYKTWAENYNATNHEGKTFDAENSLVVGLSVGGPLVIEMYPEKAPNHVQRFKELSRAGFYDGIVFHRVMEGFMAQSGDPTGTGMGGSDLPDLMAEFNDIAHTKGITSMARSRSPDSANSQFFIMFDNTPSLDGEYTVWGKVIAGIEYVDLIQRGNLNDNGAVPEADRTRIMFMKVAADIKG